MSAPSIAHPLTRAARSLMLLAFVPVAASFTLPPELALALFVAPVLLDAAFDASLRDLKDNWVPVTGLVVFAVGFTTAGVAINPSPSSFVAKTSNSLPVCNAYALRSSLKK